MQKRKVSVIIPCYNEGKRILPIIEEIKKSPCVAEIIVVDNHSDNYSQRVLKKIKNIKLVIQPQNMGKANSQKVGLLAAKSEYVAFIDADLKNFKTKDFELLIKPIVSNDYDLAISDRKKEVFYNRLLGLSVACSGERVIKKDLLLKNLDIFNSGGYLIEGAVNQRFFGHLRITKVHLDDVGQYSKVEKTGFKGLIDDCKMFLSYLKYFGLPEFTRQLITAKTLPVYQN